MPLTPQPLTHLPTAPYPPFHPESYYRPPLDLAARGCLQSATEPRHVQRHNHGTHVCGAYPRPVAPDGPSLHAASQPRPSPSHIPARTSPRFVRPPCDSAERGCLQPAAEPRHVQRHKHARHVSGAYPRPDLHSRALPCMRLAPCRPAPPTALSPLPARTPTPFRMECPPLRLAKGGITKEGQLAAAFNQPLSFDTSGVTRMDEMFLVPTLAPTPSRALPCMRLAPEFIRARHAACAVAPPPTALSPPGTHLDPPLRMPTSCDSAVRKELQSAAQLRHVQRHKHEIHVFGAYPRPDLQPGPSLRAASQSRPSPPHLPARTSPRFVSPPLRLGRAQMPSTSR